MQEGQELCFLQRSHQIPKRRSRACHINTGCTLRIRNTIPNWCQRKVTRRWHRSPRPPVQAADANVCAVLTMERCVPNVGLWMMGREPIEPDHLAEMCQNRK